MSTWTTGLKAEEIACKYLKSLGYKILERNFRIRGGEIDIVAKEGEEIVFVEVKARWSHKFGEPAEAVTFWKMKALLKTALFYLQKVKWGDKQYRVDVIAMDFLESRENPKIELIKNVTS